MSRQDLTRAVFILFFSISTALLFNHYSPHGIALTGQWEKSKGSVKAISKSDHVSSSMEILDLKIIRKIIDNKERFIVDVRTREAYEHGHLPNAVSFPLEEFDENFIDMMSIIKKDAPVLVYCESIECPDSHTFANQLVLMKYSDVKIFSGGFLAWKDKGYPIEKNEN